MAIFQISQPYPLFTDDKGKPLDNGSIYIGEEDKDPTVYPINLYWDEDLTIPALQPLSTISGYIARNGTPSKLFCAENFSILVKDKNDVILFYSTKGFSIVSTATTTTLGLVRKATDTEVSEGDPLASEAFVDPEQYQKFKDADTLTDLQALTPFAGQTIYLKGRTTTNDGGQGHFVGSGVTTDLSTEVTADTLSGIYAAPTSDPTGASGAWVRQRKGHLNPKVFGLNPTATSANNAAALQAAIEASRLVVFPDDGASYDIDMVLVSTSCEIRFNRSTLNGTGNAIIGVDTDIDYLYLHDAVARFPGVTGRQGREFFVNVEVDGVIGENTTAFPSGTVVTYYDVGKLVINNCDLAYCKVTAGGLGRTTFTNNVNEHGNTVSTAPAYFVSATGDDHSVKKDDLNIKDNTFKVYPPDGSNIDIIKVSGGRRYANISGNHVENLNTACSAQVDMFTGGDRMRFFANAMINTQLHRKQVIGSGATVNELSYDCTMMNIFDLQDTFPQSTAIYAVGSLFTMAFNQFIGGNSAVSYNMIFIDNSDTDYDGFATESAMAYIQSNNICDLRGGAADSKFILMDSSDTPNGSAVVSSNLQVGGQRFISGAPQSSAVVGNVWAESGGASGVSMNMGTDSIAIGNVADTTTPVLAGHDSGNRITKSAVAIDSNASATPSVAAGSRLTISGTGTITNFLDGYVGQTLRIISSGSAVTIGHSGTIRLNGSVPYAMTVRGTLTLEKTDSGLWTEMSRMVP